MTREERIALDGDPSPVLFYDAEDGTPFACFSNFSRHLVVLAHPFTGKPTSYLTSEHRYQALKATTPQEHDIVAAAPTPGQSKYLGRHVELRPGWDGPGPGISGLGYYVMLEVVIAKAVQHPEFRAALRDTGQHVIYEDSPTDDIWGWRRGSSYSGKNLLGRALMDARSYLIT